ncbi:MAG: mechanosensitive ion channel protein MscS [Tenericutes bacterium HGW-Tenericutes-2]|jgi:small conductance mechanosensitive channel|nr:MAG: mechanosensitive ion channel protein MscS [Tenericutes bacterium HGW-Tenericutes-2]
MFNDILLTAVALNSIFTAIIILSMIGILIVEHKLLKKNEESLKKGVIIFIYSVTFILLGLSVLGILWIWDFDLNAYFLSIYDSGMITIAESIGKIVSSAIIIFIAMLILRISKITLKRVGLKESVNQRRKRTVARVTRSITKYVVGIAAFLIVLSVWGVNVAPALAGLGIMGLVIGLGAQKFINDLISGFFIIFEHHFDVGDKIEVQGFKGEVIDIGLKTTKIRNWKNEIKILSNGEISNLINYSKEFSVAVVEFGIAYSEDVQSTIDMLNRELPSIRKDLYEIVEDPKVVGVINLSSSSVDMRVVAKTLNEQHYGVERELRKRIKQLLDQEGIEIPFPQVVVHQPVKKVKKQAKSDIE